MKLSPRTNGITLLLTALIIGILGFTVERQRRALREAALHTDSLEVAADSSRTYWVGQARVAARRAYQGQVELLAALQQGHALGATAVRLRLERDSLRRVTAGQVAHDTTARTFTATGELAAESLGVRVRADVTMRGLVPVPGAPVTSEFSWLVHRDPIVLDVALVCLPGHRAEARVTSALPGIPMTIVGATSRPDVCYPPPRWAPLSLRLPSLPWLGAAFLAGWLLRR